MPAPARARRSARHRSHPEPRWGVGGPVRRGAVALGLGSALAITGCGSSGTPSAGLGSPASATVGFLQGATDHDPTAGCRYVIIDQSEACQAALGGEQGTIAVTDLKIGAVSTSGARALVSVLGRVCVTVSGQSDCFTSTNRTAGQPSTPARFAASYAAIEAGQEGSNLATIPCVEAQGRWYVNLGS